MRLFEATQLNILQVVNLTLALGVFTALADHLGDLFRLAPGVSFFEGGGPGKIVFTLLVVVWTMKLFVDDHSHFSEHAKRPVYAIVSLLFCTLSFLTLIAAAGKLDKIEESAAWLFIHFLILLAWVATSILIRLVSDDEGAKPADQGISMRWWWGTMNLLYLAFLAMALDAGIVSGLGILFMTLLLMAVGIDAWVSDTFGLKRTSG